MLDSRQLFYDTALGAGLGALLVMSLLAFDVLNLATMVWQTEQSTLFVLMILFKPMLVSASAAAGWSVLRRPVAKAIASKAEFEPGSASYDLAYRTS